MENKDFYQGAEILFGFESISETLAAASEKIPLNLIDSYNKYKNLFEEYSKKNKPSELEETEFKALLVAVSQWETGIGAKNNCVDGTKPCSDWIMGYDNKFRDSSKGAEKQIALSSNLFKRAFEGKVDSVPAYGKECGSKSGENKILCILSIYNSGLSYEDSKKQFPSGVTADGKYARGWKYAEEVVSLKQDWKSYFINKESGFSNRELSLIENANSCGDCGTMEYLFIFGGSCTEQICSAIGDKLKRECRFNQVISTEESNCVESGDFLRSLNVSTLTANLINEFNVNNFDWTDENVHLILINTIGDYSEENGRKYSDNKYFIDQLYKRKLLLKDEYDEIRGEGIFDTEEDMEYVLNLLVEKI